MMVEIKYKNRKNAPIVPEFVEVKNVPAISPDIELVMRQTASGIYGVVYSAIKGVRRYQIVRAPQELLEEWKGGVDEIIGAIAMKDLSGVRELMKKEARLTGDADMVESMISEEILDEIDIKLLAIGLFVLREKSPWNPMRSRLKVFKGGKVRMESAFESDGWANCYDIGAIVRELAEMYGIQGKLHQDYFWHAYFETTDGKVSDPMYGWRRGGLFQTRKKFKDHKKEMGLLRKMGI